MQKKKKRKRICEYKFFFAKNSARLVRGGWSRTMLQMKSKYIHALIVCHQSGLLRSGPLFGLSFFLHCYIYVIHVCGENKTFIT